MVNQTIKTLLNRLNKGQHPELFVSRELSNFVVLSRVWLQEVKSYDDLNDSTDIPLTFYFIRNEERKFIGAVQDQLYDLHLYILPYYRNKGYMSNALKSIILPHLFQDRYFQRVDLTKCADHNSLLVAKALAIKFGCIEIEQKGNYILHQDKISNLNIFRNLKSNPNSECEGKDMTLSRIQELSKQIFYASRLLSMVQAEVELNLGDTDYSKNLLVKKNEVKDMAFYLQNSVLNGMNQIQHNLQMAKGA